MQIPLQEDDDLYHKQGWPLLACKHSYVLVMIGQVITN